jgi:hypothetical protein
MKRRYKVVLNVDVTDPEQPFPAGGSYTHLNRIDGVVRLLLSSTGGWPGTDIVTVSLDKVIDKGEITTDNKTQTD